MGGILLSGLHLYPVKSLAGLDLKRARLERHGLAHDRRWMVVDEAGVFLTQRQVPKMALVHTRLAAGGLRLGAPGMPDLELDPAAAGAARMAVEVWGDRCNAWPVGEAADAWLSDFLGRPCRLVEMPPDGLRRVDPEYGETGDRTAFSDGFPLLLISRASLEDLNRRLESPLPMRRFRPNLVVDGCAPYAEDRWRRIRIGDLGFRVVKPCSRCVITTIDPDTAEKGVEPLRTLSRYRRQGNKVMFGQNLIGDGAGELAVGMEVEVLA